MKLSRNGEEQDEIGDLKELLDARVAPAGLLLGR